MRSSHTPLIPPALLCILLPSLCLAAAYARPRRRPHAAAAAMVLEDESNSDNSSLPYMHSETSTDGLNQVSYSIGARVRVRFRKLGDFSV